MFFPELRRPLPPAARRHIDEVLRLITEANAARASLPTVRADRLWVPVFSVEQSNEAGPIYMPYWSVWRMRPDACKAASKLLRDGKSWTAGPYAASLRDYGAYTSDGIKTTIRETTLGQFLAAYEPKPPPEDGLDLYLKAHRAPRS